MADFYEPTIMPYVNFNSSEDARILRKAMKGLGTDEDKIIAVLSNRCAGQRLEIAHAFKCEFGRDLIKDLKDELGGKFEKLVLALMETPYEYLAHELNRAMKGIGTQEHILTEILCTRSNQDIHGIVSAYQEKFGESLEESIGGEVSGHYKRLLIMLLNGDRDEVSGVDMDRAAESAQTLFDAGEGSMGTDEEVFTTLLTHESFPQLQVIFDEYRKISGKTIEQAVKAELSGDIEAAILTIVKCANNRNRYYAVKLHESMKGAGTDDETLMRIIVSRCEIDLGGIKREYADFYEKTLFDSVKKETSGDYKNALLALIGEA